MTKQNFLPEPGGRFLAAAKKITSYLWILVKAACASFAILILSAWLLGCGKSPRAYSGGFSAGGMFARFDSQKPREPVYIIYLTTVPEGREGTRGTMGGDIYGNGYFTLEDGRTIRFTMPDPETVMIGSHLARLTDGRFLKVFVRPNGDSRVEQEDLHTLLAQTVLNTR